MMQGRIWTGIVITIILGIIAQWTGVILGIIITIVLAINTKNEINDMNAKRREFESRAGKFIK